MRPLPWDPRVHKLQLELRAVGLYTGKIDGRPGILTAEAVLEAWRRKLQTFDPDMPMMIGFRAAVAENMPSQREVLAEVEPYLRTDPADPRRFKWNDGGKYALANYRRWDLPVAGSLYLHRAAAWRWMLALGEIAYRYPSLSLGRTCSFNLRRRNWSSDPKVGPSLHCFGAIDFDLNLNGKWERREAALPNDTRGALSVFRSWAITLGADWVGTAEDWMHCQIGSL
jgi:hypothetical protein